VPALVGVLVVASLAAVWSVARSGGPLRIAVLPVEPLGVQPVSEPLRLALAEELVTALARTDPDDLVVIGRASVAALLDEGLDGPGIAERLNLNYWIEGSLRPSGSGHRWTLRLVDATSGAYAWSDSEDLDGERVDVVSAFVTHELTEALGLPGSWPPMSDWEAPVRRVMLEARYLRSRASVESSRTALELLTEALGPDSARVPLLVEMARHHLLLAETDEAQRTISLARVQDPDASGLDHVRGRIALYGRGDVRGAVRVLEQAVEREPGVPQIRHDYAHALTADGRTSEAAAQARIALELDPVSSLVLGDMGWVLYYAERFSEAGEACRATLTLRPESLNAARCVVLSAVAARRPADAAVEAGVLARALGASDATRLELEARVATGEIEALWTWMREPAQWAGLDPLDRARVAAMLDEDAVASQALTTVDTTRLVNRMGLRDPLFSSSAGISMPGS
jgi:TolB-like protein/Flp pilus assembly protein TadD